MIARWFAGSIWSSATRSRARSRRAASFPRRRRCTPRLKTYFEEVVRKKLSEEFGYKSGLQVPVIEKVVLNMGIGVWGMDITVCTSAKNDDEARALLSAFNFPFRQ